MSKLTEKLAHECREHELYKKEFAQNLIEMFKKKDINTPYRSKKLKTVPWETGEDLYKKQQRDEQKLKKRKRTQ